MHVASGDRGVDLETVADFANHTCGIQRGGEDSLNTPEGIMGIGCCPVQGQRNCLGPCIVQLDQDRSSEPSGHRGRKSHAEAGVVSVEAHA